MTALVTSGQTRAALAAVRGLGRAGLAVAVAAPTRPSLSFWSRYATSTVLTPKAADAALLGQRYRQEILGRNASLVLGTTNADMALLAGLREDLPETCAALLPSSAALSRVLHRQSLFDFVKSLSVSCVPRILIHAEEPLEAALRDAQRLPFPVVVRPFRDGQEGLLRSGAEEAVPLHDIGALRRLLYEDEVLASSGCVIEPRPQESFLRFGVVAQSGKALVEVSERTVRSKTAAVENVIVTETMEPSIDVRHASMTILEALQWSGPAQLSFLRLKSGLHFAGFIPRLWDTVGLAGRAGLNIPLACYRIATNQEIVGRRTAKAGLRQRWLLGDVSRAIHHVTGHDNVQDAGFFDRIKSVASLLDPRELLHAKSDIFAADDPMPFIYEAQRFRQTL